MTANTAKYLPSIADIDPKNVEITAFSGIGAISTPYRFDQFRQAGGVAGGHLGRVCDYAGVKYIRIKSAGSEMLSGYNSQGVNDVLNERI